MNHQLKDVSAHECGVGSLRSYSVVSEKALAGQEARGTPSEPDVRCGQVAPVL